LLGFRKHDFRGESHCLVQARRVVQPSPLFRSRHDQIKITIAYDVGYMHRVCKFESKEFGSKDQGFFCAVKFRLGCRKKRKANNVIMEPPVLREPPHNIYSLTDIKKPVAKSKAIYAAAFL